MNTIIEQYVKDNGAKGASFLTSLPEYGEIWSIQYGDKQEEGNYQPTGLPSLVYIENGKPHLISPDAALNILASL